LGGKWYFPNFANGKAKDSILFFELLTNFLPSPSTREALKMPMAVEIEAMKI